MSAPDRPTREQVAAALRRADELSEWSAKADRAVLAAEVRALRAELAANTPRQDVISTALGDLCPCSYDPDGPGPLQECPVDGVTFVAEVCHLRAVWQAARAFIASEDRGPFESAVAVRDLRAALVARTPQPADPADTAEVGDRLGQAWADVQRSVMDGGCNARSTTFPEAWICTRSAHYPGRQHVATIGGKVVAVWPSGPLPAVPDGEDEHYSDHDPDLKAALAMAGRTCPPVSTPQPTRWRRGVAVSGAGCARRRSTYAACFRTIAPLWLPLWFDRWERSAVAERLAQEVPIIGGNGKVSTDPIMLMCAFRYALGRATYIVGWVADELIEHRHALKAQWRQQTVRDIREALGEDDAGWGIDAAQWQRVVTAFFAVATACRGCALTIDVCRMWRPLCCDACDHTPVAAQGDGTAPDLEVWVPPAEDCMQSDHEPCPHCASRIFHRRTGRCGDCGRRP